MKCCFLPWNQAIRLSILKCRLIHCISSDFGSAIQIIFSNHRSFCPTPLWMFTYGKSVLLQLNYHEYWEWVNKRHWNDCRMNKNSNYFVNKYGTWYKWLGFSAKVCTHRKNCVYGRVSQICTKQDPFLNPRHSLIDAQIWLIYFSWLSS